MLSDRIHKRRRFTACLDCGKMIRRGLWNWVEHSLHQCKAVKKVYLKYNGNITQADIDEVIQYFAKPPDDPHAMKP